MFDRNDIRSKMEVVTADGDHVGTVDAMESRRLRLTRADSQDGLNHYLSLAEVDRIEGGRVWLKEGAEIPVGVR